MSEPSDDLARASPRLPGAALAWVWFGTVALLVVVIAALVLLHSRRDIERREGDRLQVQARVVADNMRQQIDGIDEALLGVREHLEQGGELKDSPLMLVRHVVAVTDALPGLRTLLVIDRDGVVTAASRPEFVGGRVAERAYFTEAREHAGRDLLHLSPPFRTVDGSWLVALTRTLRDEHGAFAGAVTASLDPAYFDVVMRSVLYADDMRTTLVHGNGVVFMTIPVSALAGNDLRRPGSFFMRHRESGEAATLLSGVSMSNGDARIVASRTLQREARPLDPPLVIQVSRGSDAVFAAWREQRNALVAILVLVGVGSAGVLALLQRRRREFAALEARARREREEHDRRIRMITDNLPALVAYIDSDERYRFANATYRGFFKLNPQRLVGRTMAEVFGPLYHEVQPHIASALAGEACSYERHATERGLDLYLRVDYVPDFAADGRVVGFYSMSMDITEAKRAELERTASERRLQAITDNLPVLISYIDADERIRFLNATFKQWTGIEVSAALGRKVADVVGPALYAQRSDHIQRALAGERIEFELTWRRDGRERCLHNVYVPDVDADGRTIGIYTLSGDVTAMKSVERQLFALARVDALTGLSNRAHFNETLADALARADRSGDAIALMFLDIDYFKRINDTFGHPAGDAVLKEVAARLQAVVRKTDVVARFAGDEFVVILEGLHEADEVQRLAVTVLRQFDRPIALDAGDLSITASIGIAFHDGPPITAAELLARADEGLYEAKGAGRNRSVFMRTGPRGRPSGITMSGTRVTLPAGLDDTTH
ncbi:diguanylate cyclase domain-containing protein [Piscinibacter koreensis]|uniref:Diguanylate cyclase n=1 Tax=Piscinibacter koreensis TaxID=2742824 RepID=A0A7Y6NLY8_9BURK|nr:diguanylate cyclase [Schlegelella koreensis]NUZ05527.1 diguanylate cyclase [Schlegelella koreensis]